MAQLLVDWQCRFSRPTKTVSEPIDRSFRSNPKSSPQLQISNQDATQNGAVVELAMPFSKTLIKTIQKQFLITNFQKIQLVLSVS